MPFDISPAGIAAMVAIPLIFGPIGYVFGKSLNDTSDDSDVAIETRVGCVVTAIGGVGLVLYGILGSGNPTERVLTALTGLALLGGTAVGASR